MASLAQLQTYRTTAGARYLAAVEELRSAYIELNSLELALANANIGGSAYVPSLMHFRGDADGIPTEFQHPTFAPGFRGGMVEESKAAFDLIAAAFPTPDE